jgi:transcriptional regulator with PAS, ATPase and Fis domain
LSIEIPPLRAREADIGLLSTYFINNYCHKMSIKIPDVKPDVWQALMEYAWPGNVRQLENAIIYAVNSAENDVIMLEDLPAYVRSGVGANSAVVGNDTISDKNRSQKGSESQEAVLTLEAAEKRAILAALLYTNQYVPGAADLLKIGRSTLYRKLKEYDIQV